MKKIISLIPARSGSKGVPNKNIRDLGGFPLITYSVIVSKMSKWIQRTIVSTDSQEIADIAKEAGAEIPFLRPDIYSTDTATDIEWINHALSWLKENENYEPDVIVHLRPTTPLRESELVDIAIGKLLQCPKATGLRSVHLQEESPYKMFVKDEQYLKPFIQSGQREFYNLPRQFFQKVYAPNGYVDVLRMDTIKNGFLHGEKMIAFHTDEIIEVDSERNLEELRKIFHKSPLFELLMQRFSYLRR